LERPPRRNCVVDSSRERHVCREEAVEERYPLEAWKQEYSQDCFHENMQNYVTALLMVLAERNFVNYSCIVEDFSYVVSDQLFNLSEEQILISNKL